MPVNSPNKAFIVCGSPASGKTTYGRKLAAQNKAVLIDIDTSTERLVKLALRCEGRNESDRDSLYFKDTFRKPIYEQMFDLACDNLPFNHVVLVGPFTLELGNPLWLNDLQVRLNAAVEVHYLKCKPEVLRKRLIKRNNPRDKAKLAQWNTYLQYYKENALPKVKHILIETQ
ncbi:MAG: hypothetical protein CR997_10300 [Acidobacteria bacterium]|nr:MAG: hypothetical protein CR997_10300 [Acidobacteriota bacterium]